MRCSARSAAAWIDRLDAEQMNIRQALRWALDTGAAQEGLRLAGALTWYWHLRGPMAEGEQWLAELLALPAGGSAHHGTGQGADRSGLMRRSTRLLDGAQSVDAETQALAAEALAIARETGDKVALGLALLRAWRLDRTGGLSAGRAMLEECMALVSRAGRPARV